jgi:hypothetical protein
MAGQAWRLEMRSREGPLEDEETSDLQMKERCEW